MFVLHGSNKKVKAKDFFGNFRQAIDSRYKILYNKCDNVVFCPQSVLFAQFLQRA